MFSKKRKRSSSAGRDSKGRIKKGYRLTKSGVRKVAKKKRR